MADKNKKILRNGYLLNIVVEYTSFFPHIMTQYNC